MDSQKDATENLGSSRCYASVLEMMDEIDSDVSNAVRKEFRIRMAFRISWWIGSFVVGYSIPQVLGVLLRGEWLMLSVFSSLLVAGSLLAWSSYRRLYA